MRQGSNDPTSLGQTAKAKIEEIFAFEKLGTTGYNMYILQCKFGCQSRPNAPNFIMSTEVCHYRLFKGHTDCGSEQAVETPWVAASVSVSAAPPPCRSTEQSAAIQIPVGGATAWFFIHDLIWQICFSRCVSRKKGLTGQKTIVQVTD